MTEVVAFLPCRSGSQRVPNKNTRPFAGEPGGLLALKLNQLVASKTVDRVLVSTNDPVVIERTRAAMQGQPRIELDLRPDHLCTSATLTDELISYVPSIIPAGIVLWTHVTSPFVGADEYDGLVGAYRDAVAKGENDSLMAVNNLQTFLWQNGRALNYDRSREKWPRTQTLEPVHVVNSAAFIIDVALMKKFDDRIGEKPLLYEMDELTAFEVDWPEQFAIAEMLYTSRRKTPVTHTR
jgi:CMP-N-acetylneuraminic acid synthetase